MLLTDPGFLVDSFHKTNVERKRDTKVFLISLYIYQVNEGA